MTKGSPGSKKIPRDRPPHRVPIHPVKARPGGDEIEAAVAPVDFLGGGLDEADIR